MGSLPEELWIQILQSGLRNVQLQGRDLCALAIVSRRLKRICELDCVWKQLLEQDFPEPAVAGSAVADCSLRRLGSEGAVFSCKKLYKTRYEKVKERKMAAHKRLVLRVTSSINVLQRERLLLQKMLQSERDRLLSSRKELENLERTSRSSVALQIWQPQAVTTRHEQVVQQVRVDLAARKNSVRSEVSVCKLHIQCLENNLRSRKASIEGKERELEGLTYNPTVDLSSSKDPACGKKGGTKRKSVDIVSQPSLFASLK